MVHVSGNVTDSVCKKPLGQVNILISWGDKSIKKVLSDVNGRFLVFFPDTGSYTVDINLMGYRRKTMVGRATVLQQRLERVLLVPTIIELKTVEISAKKKVRDTIEFDTRLYPVDINSFSRSQFSVIPGMEIDRKRGGLRYQGSEITKLYVDGEPFFEKGPNTALEFLRSGAISKIQVYYENKIKVVNIILKPNAKKGRFGGFEGLIGKPDINGTQVTANTFNKKRRIGFSGLTNSFGNAKVNWNDPKAIEFNNSLLQRASAVSSFLRPGITFDSGEGVPNNKLVNGFFSDKWKKSSLSADYQYILSQTSSVFGSRERNLLPEILTTTLQQGERSIGRNGNNLSIAYEAKIGNSLQLKLSSQSQVIHYDELAVKNNLVFKENKGLITSQIMSQQLDGDHLSTENRIQLGFDVGKSLNMKILLAQAYSYRSGWSRPVTSTSVFDYQPTDVSTVQDRNSISSNKNYELFARLRYKLTGKTSLVSELTGTGNFTNNAISGYMRSYGKTNSDSTIQSREAFDNYAAGLKMGINFRFKENSIELGGAATYNSYLQKDNVQQRSDQDNFLNTSPYLNLSFGIGDSRRLDVDYANTPVRPMSYQRQRLYLDADPMHIIVGNPNLKQGQEHEIKVIFSDSDLKTSRSLAVNLLGRLKRNSISEMYSVDTLGRTVTQFINVNGNYNLNAAATYNVFLKAIKTRLAFTPSISTNQDVYIVNNRKIDTRNNALRLAHNSFFTIGGDNGFSFDLVASIGLNQRVSNIGQLKFTYSTQDYGLTVYKTLFRRFDLTFENEFNIIADQQFFISNMAVSVGLLKNRPLVVALQANDLFNQRKGINITTNDYLIREHSFSTQRQYVFFRAYFKLANKIGKENAIY